MRDPKSCFPPPPKSHSSFHSSYLSPPPSQAPLSWLENQLNRLSFILLYVSYVGSSSLSCPTKSFALFYEYLYFHLKFVFTVLTREQISCPGFSVMMVSKTLGGAQFSSAQKRCAWPMGLMHQHRKVIIRGARDIIWNKMGGNLKYHPTPTHFIPYNVPWCPGQNIYFVLTLYISPFMCGDILFWV